MDGNAKYLLLTKLPEQLTYLTGISPARVTQLKSVWICFRKMYDIIHAVRPRGGRYYFIVIY